MRPNPIKGVASWLLDWLFPPKCPFCRALLLHSHQGLCPTCQQELPWLVGPAAQRTGEFYRLCVSPLRYQGRVRESFHRYKFRGARHYAPVYGQLMAQCVQDHLSGDFDLITWAPLAKKRRRKRGYDQSQLLAQVIGQTLNIPVLPTLKKTQNIQAQSALGTDQATRRANVLGAYDPLPNAPIQGQRILLVDDIITTSSTLSECARVLCTAGAKEVVCVTLAQAKGEEKKNS